MIHAMAFGFFALLGALLGVALLGLIAGAISSASVRDSPRSIETEWLKARRGPWGWRE